MKGSGFQRDPSSYRDPAGHVFHYDEEIYRTVTKLGAEDYVALKQSILELLIQQSWLIPTSEVDIGEHNLNAEYLLKHEKIPFISYPYEWSFELLKSAAIFHLDFHLLLLEHDFTLKDASAYNVQFVNRKPIFIDFLSIKKYNAGEFWVGQKQFTEQFLIPLLLGAKLGINHNPWYRGSFDGISTSDFIKLLPIHKKLSLRHLLYIFLPEYFQVKNLNQSSEKLKGHLKEKTLSKSKFTSILLDLKKWITKLEFHNTQKTTWSDYSFTNTYTDQETKAKHEFIYQNVKRADVHLVVDIGCNTGNFSQTAFNAGVNTVIGLDFDFNAINQAYINFQDTNHDFLGLQMDLTNPSPDLGWNNLERLSLSKRLHGDFVIALAFIHHLVIAKNIQLDEVVEWLVSIAPKGIIEFVNKNDPTVQKLLAIREDIFDEYNKKNFERILTSKTSSFKSKIITKDGRTLYSFIK